MKKINFTNEERAIIMNYLRAKAELEALETKVKALKAEAEQVFATHGEAYKVESKTTYAVGTVQKQGKPEPIVYKVTEVKGVVDTAKLYKDLNLTEEILAKYRKSATVRKSIDWATDKQREELGL